MPAGLPFSTERFLGARPLSRLTATAPLTKGSLGGVGAGAGDDLSVAVGDLLPL